MNNKSGNKNNCTHLGPASACETVDSTETIKNEYHWSGKVEKNTQTIDGSLLQIMETTFDNGGNQITVKMAGSGTGANVWNKTLNIDNQYYASTPDDDNFNKTAILDGANTYTYDGSNTFNYTYDDNGNTTEISSRFMSLNYDNLNRLREITYSAPGSEVDRYSYNAAGLRFKKEEDVSGSNIVIYSMYSGNNAIIQEKYDGATLIETRFNIISGGRTGRNDSGQLGDGSILHKQSPVRIIP